MPRTRARKAHDLNHTARESNDSSFGESTHASTVEQGVEKQPNVNLSRPPNNTNGTSNTTTSEIHHS